MSRRIDHFTHHSQTNAHNAQHTSLLEDIKTNTANIKLEAETIDVNVADLEVLQTAANVLLTTANTNSAHISDNLDQVNTNLGVLDGELELITGQATSTNSKLDTINTTLTGGSVVNISTLATHAKQDTLNTTLGTLATHAKQDTINTTLGSLATESTLNIIAEEFTKCDTDNVVITGSALPAGASTSANQTTINTTLGSVVNQFRSQWSNGNGGGTALGPAVALLATHAKQDTLNTTLGTLATSVIQTNGTQQAKCMGIGDDGANKQMKTDNSGNVSAFLVSDVIMKPSNITNGDHASFSGSSVASMLRCRTDINNNATGVFLLCDSAGALSVNSKSSVVKTTGEWLATSTAIGDDNYSSALDCSSFKEVRLFGKLDGLAPSSLDILGSTAESGSYYKIGTLDRNTIEIGGVGESHFTAHLQASPNFIKIYNNSGSGITCEFDYIGLSV